MNKTSPLLALQSARQAVRARTQRWLAPDGLFGRWFENLILALIVLSVASVILEETPNLPNGRSVRCTLKRCAVVVVFTFEYLLRPRGGQGSTGVRLQLPGPG